MIELLTAAEMRRTERTAIEGDEVTGLELMERAGAGVVEMTFREWPALAESPHSAVILCGPGNNGGDGYVVARLLHDRDWKVSVYAYGDPEQLPPDAYRNYHRWIERNGVRPLSEAEQELCSTGTALVVDAVFGTGLTRPISQDLAKVLATVESRGDGKPSPFVVSVDVPTGICSDSGREIGGGCDSDLTVTFHRARPGHYLGDGPRRCGAVCVVDIGLGGSGGTASINLGTQPRHLHRNPRAEAHKYDHGHLLVLGGESGKGGAARLAAHGALRIGSGLVTLGCPSSALQENAAQLNAVMLKSIDSGRVLADLLDRNPRIDALCLGPGLGTGERQRQFVAAALRSRKAAVLDADALTIVSHDNSLFSDLHSRCVLTPHEGEFSRLFPDMASRLDEQPGAGPAYSKVDAVRDAAARAGCTILLKGPATVIAAPDGPATVNSACYGRSVPWLATAGSGDVLAGFVAGLLARGFEPREAGASAAYVHVECALQFGPGLIAEDLPDQLPSVLRELTPWQRARHREPSGHLIRESSIPTGSRTDTVM